MEEERVAFISSRCLRKGSQGQEAASSQNHPPLGTDNKLSSDKGALTDEGQFSDGTASSDDDGCSCSDRSPPLDAETCRGLAGNGAWAHGFKPRPVEEVTRNCARVKESVKFQVVSSVFRSLLAQPPRWVPLPSSCQAHPQTPPGLGMGTGTSCIAGTEEESCDGVVACTCREMSQWNRGGKRGEYTGSSFFLLHDLPSSPSTKSLICGI